jgi:hypothetical protein
VDFISKSSHVLQVKKQAIGAETITKNRPNANIRTDDRLKPTHQ